MSVEQPMIRLTCDGCGNKDEVEVAYMYHGYSERSGFWDIETTFDNLRESGWEIPYSPDEDGRIDFCPNCTEKADCSECGERDFVDDNGRCENCSVDYCKICGDNEVDESTNFVCEKCKG